MIISLQIFRKKKVDLIYQYECFSFANKWTSYDGIFDASGSTDRSIITYRRVNVDKSGTGECVATPTAACFGYTSTPLTHWTRIGYTSRAVLNPIPGELRLFQYLIERSGKKVFHFDDIIV